MLNIINSINSLLWSTPLLVLILGAGILFAVRTKFVQFRHFSEMLQLTFKSGDKNDKGLSSFQALSMTLASAIGTGNIAGVATAITLGGPGAVFWMWIVALIGAGTSVIENTLGQIYKQDFGDEYRGGPAYYLEKATNKRWIGMVFAVVTVIAYGWCLYAPQTNAISSSLKMAFNVPVAVSGAVVCIFVALIIVGGAKRIGEFASMVVPVMGVAYILLAVILLLKNYAEVPGMLAMIVRSGLNKEAAFSGIIGSAIAMGVKRGLFSNEAGQGTSPHGSSTSNVDHPVKQGLIQGLCVYIDTILVCTATALMILITQKYNIVDASGAYIVNNIGEVTMGVNNAQLALDTLLPGYGMKIIAVALFFFAFTSCVACSFYAESNLIYIMRGKNKAAINILRVVMLCAMFFGAVKESDIIWALTDVGLGSMAWVNIVGLLFIHNISIKALKDYEKQKKEGIENPVFDPEKLEIPRANYWVDRLKR